MQTLPDRGKAHFIGICGAGMSGVAKLLRDRGWAISGSDEAAYPPLSDLLVQEGLPCRTPYDPGNIPADTDIVVIGKHARLVPEANDEVRRAMDLRDGGQVRVFSYPEVLHDLTRRTTNIVVTGSYGKSTTTALITWAFREAGQDPSYFIGAVPENLAHNAELAKGRYFVLEGDEYPASNWDRTSKFRYYNAHVVVLTSCAHDHLNEFPALSDYLACYEGLIASLPEDALVVACLDGEHVPQVLRHARCRVRTYSSRADSDADYRVASFDPGRGTARARLEGRRGGVAAYSAEVETPLIGLHNMENTLAAAAVTAELGAVPPEQFAAAMRGFQGLRRRLERKTGRSSVQVYEDLSSSRPKAVAALEAVRGAHPDGTVMAVFQPHTFSFRSRSARGWYAGMFRDVDIVCVYAPPELRGLASDEQMSHAEIVEAIAEGNPCEVRTVGSAEQVVAYAGQMLRPGDAVVLMTSGAMGGIIDPVVAGIEVRFPVS